MPSPDYVPMAFENLRHLPIKKFAPLVGILIFVYILVKLDLGRLYTMLVTTDLRYLALCALLSPCILVVMAVRWNIILRGISIRYPWLKAWESLVKGSLFGEITPGRVGELLRARYVTKDTDCSLGKSIFSVVIDRIYDIVVLLALVLISCLVLLKLYAVDIPLLAIIGGAAGIVSVFAVVLNKRIISVVLTPLLNACIPKHHQDTAHFHINEFYGGLADMSGYTHAVCLLFSLAVWSMKLLGMFWLAKALRIPTSFWFIFSVGAIVTIISLLPISISGFGTREAACIVLFSFQNISAEFAVALSFLYLAFGLWGIAVSGAAAYGLRLRPSSFAV